MTREEFETLTGTTVSIDDYRIIEFVYTWHPNIGNVSGKDQVAELYKVGGIEIFKDMRRAATIGKEYHNRISCLQSQIADLEEQLKDTREEYERAIENR